MSEPKVVLITGASSGIGAACAHHIVKAGHKVAIAARSIDKLANLVDELGKDHALAIECDVTSLDEQKAMIEKAVEHYGKVDVVFANAGLGASAAGTENGDPDNFKTMIDTNVFGATLTAHVAIPVLKKSKGHLVMTGSRAGRATLSGSVYGATKWYIRGYVQNLRQELSGTGVRVSNLEPGMVDTPFFDDEKPQALRADDIARAFVFMIDQPATAMVADMLVIPTPPVED
ncbi:SDR family oxidoreductase [Pseudahrensia aquimaris]|uniref:SDR family oxidoreductase n=1 Tax=Pseudahrensia aquimaris TaxID=744461 RepID=A0ABW3FJ64_9HYPH